MTKTPKPWTTADVQCLEDLYVMDRYTLSEIASIMDRHSKANIWASLRRFGIYARHGHRTPGPRREQA